MRERGAIAVHGVRVGAALVVTLAIALAFASPRAGAAIVSEAVAHANYRGSNVVSPAVRQGVAVSPGVAALELAIGPVAARQLFPGFHEVGYAVAARNAGTLTLDGLGLEEDINADLAPDEGRARVLAGPWLDVRQSDVRGPAGIIGANPAFDGRTDRAMLALGAGLAPGAGFELGVRLHLMAPADRLGFDPSIRATASQLRHVAQAHASSTPPAETFPSGSELGAELRADKRIVFAPVDEDDGWARLTYRLGVRAGEKDVEGLTIRDDLAAGFGRGRYQVVALDIVAAPEAFGATANPFFDGAGDRDLLTSGGRLGQGEAMALDLTLRAKAPGQARANAMVARGAGLKPAEARVVTSLPAPAVPPPIRLAISADRQVFGPGDAVGYEMRISGDGTSADIAVRLPAGFSYLAGSGRVDGLRREPAADEDRLLWSGTVPGRQGMHIAFTAVAGAAVADGRYVTTGYARDAATGAIVSDVASVAIARDEEAVFDCTGIVGTVFDDANQDGFRQAGEAGIAGVKVALEGLPEPGHSRTSLAVLSRRDGTYELPCASLGREAAGSEAVIALAPPTLPFGHRATTPLSRSLVLRRGRVARADFGATALPRVAFRLDAGSFEEGTTRLTPAALRALARLIVDLERKPAILRIGYAVPDAREDTASLAARRVEAARELADTAWQTGARPHVLIIETQIGDGAGSDLKPGKSGSAPAAAGD